MGVLVNHRWGHGSGLRPQRAQRVNTVVADARHSSTGFFDVANSTARISSVSPALTEEPRISFALNALDLQLAGKVRKRRGFFVEAGANDGVSQSNTLYFERYLGWRGLLIEPIPELWEKCRRNRPKAIVEKCALVSLNYPEREIDMRYCNLLVSFVAPGDLKKLTRHTSSRA